MKRIKQLLCGGILLTTTLFSATCIGETSDQKQITLPPEQIQRFIHTIAAIQHYYIKKTTDQKLFNNAISGMVSSLDPHSDFLDKDALKDLNATVSGKFVGVGIELTTDKGALKVITPLEDTPADKAGIKAGDLIIKVNDLLVANMTLREAVNRIKGKRGTIVTLTIIRKNTNKPLIFAIKRDEIKIKTVKSKMLENGYGYARISLFQGPVDKSLITAIKKLKSKSDGRLKGLVLDIRNNPGGLLNASAKVADIFLNSNILHKYNNVIVYTKGRIPDSDLSFKAHPGDLLEGAPMVVLINNGSASASEIVAGALQDYKRAIILGTRSFGKGSVQTVIPISKDNAIKLTTALYHTPSGRVIQAKGIQPNVVVPNFEINKADPALLSIDESDYENHLANGNAKEEQKRLEKLKKMRQKEVALAKEDYQLYEALMMLKGMNALR